MLKSFIIDICINFNKLKITKMFLLKFIYKSSISFLFWTFVKIYSKCSFVKSAFPHKSISNIFIWIYALIEFEISSHWLSLKVLALKTKAHINLFFSIDFNDYILSSSLNKLKSIFKAKNSFEILDNYSIGFLQNFSR